MLRHKKPLTITTQISRSIDYIKIFINFLELINIMSFLCRHFQKDCLKCKVWFEKKGMLNTYYVCFESNLTKVPHNSW